MARMRQNKVYEGSKYVSSSLLVIVTLILCKSCGSDAAPDGKHGNSAGIEKQCVAVIGPHLPNSSSLELFPEGYTTY